MPRRSILTTSEKDSLVAIPESEEELIRYYTLSETDLSLLFVSIEVQPTGLDSLFNCVACVILELQFQLNSHFHKYFLSILPISLKFHLSFGGRMDVVRKQGVNICWNCKICLASSFLA